MGFLLRMNGTTDKLEIPQFQFDKVILDIMVTHAASAGARPMTQLSKSPA